MNFDWDDGKKQLNYEKHSILFEDVCRIRKTGKARTPGQV